MGSSTMMDKVFQQCNFGYNYTVIEVPYPTTASQNVFEKQQSISNMEYDGTTEDVMLSPKNKTNTVVENVKKEGTVKKDKNRKKSFLSTLVSLFLGFVVHTLPLRSFLIF